MRHDKATLQRQRRDLAIVGFLLPVVCLILGLPFIETNGENFWHSISAMYYATCGDIMVGALSIFGGFLITYLGCDIGDRLTCILSGCFAWGIAIFPCKCDAAGPTTGVFNLPTNVSHVIHCIFAALFFASLAYMIGFRFTKTNVLIRTEEKKIRDKIYSVCSYIILGAMVCQVFTSVFGITWMTIVNETIMLWAFSFAWTVKANLIKYFNDKE